MSYIGHMVLYYWNQLEEKAALLARFSARLSGLIGGEQNIVSQIGGVHLWAPVIKQVNSDLKREVLENRRKRLSLDEPLFRCVMEKLGVSL